MKLSYHWTDCPGCQCHVAVNYAIYEDRVKGSYRRWSSDYRINDGKLIEVPREDLVPNSPGKVHFSITCRCGQELTIPVLKKELVEGGMVFGD